MFTIIFLERRILITKEAMEKYCKAEKIIKDSVNDDIDSFFEDLRLGKEPNENVHTYFLPKLTEAELKLVERKDTSYFETFLRSNPDVEEAEMKLSESNSKFVEGLGSRITFTIENTSKNTCLNISKSCKLQ